MYEISNGTAHAILSIIAKNVWGSTFLRQQHYIWILPDYTSRITSMAAFIQQLLVCSILPRVNSYD